MTTTSKFDNLTLLTTSKFDNFIISSHEIVSLIRNLNKGKANGPDDVSAHMLILCDETIAIPFKLIYEQVFATATHTTLNIEQNQLAIKVSADNYYYRNASG